MKITAFAFAATALLSVTPAGAGSFDIGPKRSTMLIPVQDESQRTITSQPNPSLGARGNGLGIEGGSVTTPSVEPRSRIRPYRWRPGAEILDNRDLGLGLVEPDPLQNDPLIGDPNLDGQDSGTTGSPGSTTTSPSGSSPPSLGTVPSIGSSPPIGSSSSTGAPTTGSSSIGSSGSLDAAGGGAGSP